jgi:hypothetical protein
MDALGSDSEIIERTLCELARIYESSDGVRTIMAFDRDHGQFLLLGDGWRRYDRVYGVWAHIELRDGEFWVQEDGTEVGIANKLVDAGVPPERIVLAFNAPAIREPMEAVMGRR